MDDIKKLIPILAENNASVLLYGEKGSGKSYIASLVHQKKGGNTENFYEINCKSFTEEKNREVLQKASSEILFTDKYGTLFINCINKMGFDLQKSCLDFITRSGRLGKNLKVISSTEENLEQKISEKSFLSELFYKINSVVINVLPLRQRKDEIPYLMEFYRKLYCRQTGFNFTSYSESAVQLLQNYFFAGNIDELKNLIQHAFIVGEPPLLKASDFFLAGNHNQGKGISDSSAMIPSPSDLEFADKSLKTALDTFKKEYVTKILEENGWNQTKTARILGIQRTYVIRLINELHIKKN